MNGPRFPITLVASVGVHAVLLGLILLYARGLPSWNEPAKTATVELVMVEHQGDVAPAGSTPSPPPPPAAPPKPAREPSPTPPAESVPMDDRSDTSMKTNEPQRDATQTPDPARTETPVAPTPPQPPAPPAPSIHLSGTDSPSDAIASGDHVLPAAPDAVFHNRPPAYPPAAAASGERGAVVLVIHISPAGRAASVDVERSSGYILLDSAARDAVMAWRFLPAVKGGQPVRSDLRMQFVFENR